MKGMVTPNGRYIVVVEGSEWSILALETAIEGGLTCFMKPLKWNCPLNFRSSGDASVAITVQEFAGCFDLLAVDGPGLVLSTRINVLGVPGPDVISSSLGPQMVETSSHDARYWQSSGESAVSSHRSGSSMT